MPAPPDLPDGGPFTADELERYATAIVRDCVLLKEGDLLVVLAELAHRPLVVAVVRAAYALGAHHVDVPYTDPLVTRARLALAPASSLGDPLPWDLARLRALISPDAGMVGLWGDEWPDATADLDPERVGAEQLGGLRRRRFFVRAFADARLRWCGAAYPSEGWARRVYPELDGGASRRLAEDLLGFCRLAPDDPPNAWAEHVARLGQRAGEINARRFRRLELRAPGTALDIGLPPDARFLSAGSENAYGERGCANYPTEEVFTSPQPAQVDGEFRCTRPADLSGMGRLVEGLRGEFRGGRLVRFETDDEAGRATMETVFGQDDGARRLGEIALVDRSSRIGQAGRVYYSGLLDENAAAHMAFGQGFPVARDASDGTRRSAVNRSQLHLDVMIGSDELEVTGVEPGGARMPLIAGGAWQL